MVGSFVKEMSGPRMDSAICPEDWESAAPLLILCGDQAAFDSNTQAVVANYLFIRTEQMSSLMDTRYVATP